MRTSLFLQKHQDGGPNGVPNEASDPDMTDSANGIPNGPSTAFLGEIEDRISLPQHSCEGDCLFNTGVPMRRDLAEEKIVQYWCSHEKISIEPTMSASLYG